MRLSLNEIIWEITGKCANRCDYCGSKVLALVKAVEPAEPEGDKDED